MLIHKMPPNGLDKFAASPVGDKKEFEAAFAALQAHIAREISEDVRYIGTDGTLHYFQEWGNPTAFCVPVSEGWKLNR